MCSKENPKDLILPCLAALLKLVILWKLLTSLAILEHLFQKYLLLKVSKFHCFRGHKDLKTSQETICLTVLSNIYDLIAGSRKL